MGDCLRQMVVLFGVTAKRRKFWLISAFTLALSSLGVSEPALAQATPPCSQPPTVVCPTGTYSNGIGVTGAGNLNVTLQSGVNVTGFGAPPNNSINAVDITNFGGGGTTTVTMENGASINVTSAGVQNGISVLAAGDASVTASGTINVLAPPPRQDAIGVFVTSEGATAKVTYTGPSNSAGLMSCCAPNGTIIQARVQTPPQRQRHQWQRHHRCVRDYVWQCHHRPIPRINRRCRWKRQCVSGIR